MFNIYPLWFVGNTHFRCPSLTQVWQERQQPCPLQQCLNSQQQQLVRVFNSHHDLGATNPRKPWMVELTTEYIATAVCLLAACLGIDRIKTWRQQTRKTGLNMNAGNLYRTRSGLHRQHGAAPRGHLSCTTNRSVRESSYRALGAWSYLIPPPASAWITLPQQPWCCSRLQSTTGWAGLQRAGGMYSQSADGDVPYSRSTPATVRACLHSKAKSLALSLSGVVAAIFSLSNHSVG